LVHEKERDFIKGQEELINLESPLGGADLPKSKSEEGTSNARGYSAGEKMEENTFFVL